MDCPQRFLAGKRTWVLLTFIGMMPGWLAAQQALPSKKEIKQYNEAVQKYVLRDEAEALEVLEEILKRNPAYFDALMLKSQILEGQRQWRSSADVIVQAVEYHPQQQLRWLEHALELLHKSGSYETAANWMAHAEALEGWAWKDSLLRLSISFAWQSFQNPVEIHPNPLLGDVNTANPEYYPAIYASGDRMVITRQIGGQNRYQGQEDFFEIAKEGDEWNVVRPLYEINTMGNEGAPTIRGDGRRIIFTACAGIDGSYGSREGKGSCDLFVSEWDANEGVYREAENLNRVNSKAWESQPSLSADGQTLLFVRAYRSESQKTVQDIYQCDLKSDGSWSPPRRLPAHINSLGREENPVLHPDGQTLYFASDGHPGMGGMDLFISRKEENGDWGMPMNLGYPINTQADENSLQVFPNGSKALFASDRLDIGNLDLWEFDLPKSSRAQEVSLWKGRVVNARTGRPVAATVQVLEESGSVVSLQSTDAKDGRFTLTFPSETSVIVQVEHPDFAFYSAGFDADKVQEEVAIELTPLEVGTVISLKDVRFETGSAVLDEVFQPELIQLSKTMLQSEIRIRVIGHTDGLGVDTENLVLSFERASAVRDYLVSLGVKTDRIEMEGRGETEPIGSNETEEGRSMNRRTEILVID